MTKETNEIVDEQQIQDETQTNETSEHYTPFEKYRNVYLRDRLSKMKVTDEEMDASLSFINERTDDNDDNLEDVLQTLDTRMRLKAREHKRTYADPSAGNSGKSRPVKKDGRETGAKMWQKVKRKVRK